MVGAGPCASGWLLLAWVLLASVLVLVQLCVGPLQRVLVLVLVLVLALALDPTLVPKHWPLPALCLYQPLLLLLMGLSWISLQSKKRGEDDCYSHTPVLSCGNGQFQFPAQLANLGLFGIQQFLELDQQQLFVFLLQGR